MNDKEDIVDFLMSSLINIDESLEKKDINAAVRKVHECIEKIKFNQETERYYTCEHSGCTFKVKEKGE